MKFKIRLINFLLSRGVYQFDVQVTMNLDKFL